MQRYRGFSLVELMIVVAIVGILSAIAYPSYINHITRSARVAAQGCLSEYAQLAERTYTTNLSYAGIPNPLPVLQCVTDVNGGGAQNRYTFTLQAATATTFELRANAQGGQAARDTDCNVLILNQQGTRTSLNAAGADSAGCW